MGACFADSPIPSLLEVAELLFDIDILNVVDIMYFFSI